MKKAIQIINLKKRYRLGLIGAGSLRADLQSLWAKLRGKEDPNIPIGMDSRSNGKTFMALNGVSLTVNQGEALGIIGHNGAGKSTLLKLLSRITAPTSGEIGINGRVSSMLEVGAGFNSEMTGRENIYMNGAILGMSRAEVDAKIEKIIDFSEIREFIDTPVKRYSSGMYVKLAFAVAAHLDSEIMIMDEVLAVGDMAFQKKCLAKMREAAAQDGRTVLYVSHNMNTIRQLCDRCIVLDKGQIIFDGDTEKAIAVYMGSYSESLTPYREIKRGRQPSRACINAIAFPDKTDCLFNHGEPVKIRLVWTMPENIGNIRIRLIIRNQDDLAVGIALSPPVAAAAGNNTLDFEFDASALAEGQYYISTGLFQSDENGNAINLDNIPRAIAFEKCTAPDDELNWSQQWSGSIRFPELTLTE